MARRNRNLKTYGRHKQRTIQADLWSSEDDKDKNIFSSSSASNNSTLNSTKDTSQSNGSVSQLSVNNDTSLHNDVFINGGNPLRNRQRRNICYGKENQRRRAGLRQMVDVIYFPSSESDGGCSGAKPTVTGRVTRRALRDKNEVNIPQSTQTLNSYLKKSGKKIKNSSIPSFSEFDDYSLILTDDSIIRPQHSHCSEKNVLQSDSNMNGKRIRHKSNIKCNTSMTTMHLMCDDESSLVNVISDQSNLITENGCQRMLVETSTPFTERTCKSIVDISHIEIVDCIPDFRCTNRPPYFSIYDQSDNSNSIHNVKSSLDVTGSPSIFESKSVDQQPQKNSSNNHVKDDLSAQCLVKLDRLRESFLSMHINSRKSHRSEEPSHAHKKSLDNSESLFSSLEISRDVPSTLDSVTVNETENSLIKTSETESDDGYDDTDDVEIENLSEIREEDEESEQMDENTKYELNDSYQGDWLNSEKTDSSETGSDNSSKSIYCTAESDSCKHSLDSSSFHTADRPSPNSSDFSQSSRCMSSAWVENTSHQKDILFLEKSFRDILTPIKVNCEDVPLSPHTKVLDVCDQRKPLPFTCCIFEDMMAKCVKIGEGVYGEVFRTQNLGSVALKIIPIEGDFTVNDEPQKTYAEILPEIVISKELSSLRYTAVCRTENFCEVKRVCCVQGKYPPKLLQEWDVFHKQKKSENDRPTMFGTEQLFIMFEFADGGKDLESCNFRSISQAYHVMVQVVFSLAVAEEALQFEHRDLHWGNVLVRKMDKEQITYNLSGCTFEIDSGKLEVSIIDFTLSRLRKDECTVFCDLATDESLFQGEGDYQFEIYRKMQEGNGNKWEPFNPGTNVLWVHYLADKLVRVKRYSSNTRDEKNLLRDFRQFLKDVLNYSSACDIVFNCPFINSSVH